MWRAFRWYREGGPMATFTTLSFTAAVFVGGFSLGLKYATVKGTEKSADALSLLTDPIDAPLWLLLAMTVAGLVGIEAVHRADRKAKAKKTKALTAHRLGPGSSE